MLISPDTVMSCLGLPKALSSMTVRFVRLPFLKSVKNDFMNSLMIIGCFVSCTISLSFSKLLENRTFLIIKETSSLLTLFSFMNRLNCDGFLPLFFGCLVEVKGFRFAKEFLCISFGFFTFDISFALPSLSYP